MALNITKFIISVLLISLVGIITFSWLIEGNNEYDTPFPESETVPYLASYNDTGIMNTSMEMQAKITELKESESALAAGFYLVKDTLYIIKLPFSYMTEAFTAMANINKALPFVDVRVYVILTILLTVVIAMLIFQLIINRKVY